MVNKDHTSIKESISDIKIAIIIYSPIDKGTSISVLSYNKTLLLIYIKYVLCYNLTSGSILSKFKVKGL